MLYIVCVTGHLGIKNMYVVRVTSHLGMKSMCCMLYV